MSGRKHGPTHQRASVPRSAPLDSAERERLVRRARLLAWSGNAWHFIEFAIAVGAGIAAGSIALVTFGADSLDGAAAEGHESASSRVDPRNGLLPGTLVPCAVSPS